MSSRFDKEAADWDSNPDINAINDEIAKYLPSVLAEGNHILEIGCGTGLLAFRSFNLVKAWHGIDTSLGMISMLTSKIPAHPGSENVVTCEVLFLETPEQIIRDYTWAVSAMTFHHIPNMQAMITCLYGCVSKGIVIVDYEQWEGSRVFHPESKMSGVERHGLSGTQVEGMCREAGFEHVEVSVGFTLTLKREGRDVAFPFLIIKAMK